MRRWGTAAVQATGRRPLATLAAAVLATAVAIVLVALLVSLVGGHWTWSRGAGSPGTTMDEVSGGLDAVPDRVRGDAVGAWGSDFAYGASDPTGPAALVVAGRFRVQRPAGWRARNVVRGQIRSLCLEPIQGDDQPVFGCRGVNLFYGAALPGANGAAYRPDTKAGWFSASSAVSSQRCPLGVPGRSNVVDRTTLRLDRGTRTVGSGASEVTADWNRWYARCSDGSMFTPQAWFLPRRQLLAVDYLDHTQTARVLGSLRPVGDGR